VPLQLKRRRQSVHTFIQQLHHAIVAAINIDFANPNRARRFNPHRVTGRSNRRPAQPSKTFPHPFKKTRPTLVPLISIVFPDELGHLFPISAVDCSKEMLCVNADLMLGSPKPEQIQADTQCSGQHAGNCSTKRYCHTRRLFPNQSRQSARINDQRSRVRHF